MPKESTYDIVNRIIHQLPIDNANINEIITFKNLIQKEINLKASNYKKIIYLQNKYSHSNNPLGILPSIYLESKYIDDLFLNRLEQFNNALEICIKERCNHVWIEDIYEDAMEREIKIKFCTKCGNCHKIKF